MFAKVAKIDSPVASPQTVAEAAAKLLNFLADSPSFPSVSIRKNPIAKSKPIVEKLAARDKNLLIANKFIAR